MSDRKIDRSADLALPSLLGQELSMFCILLARLAQCVVVVAALLTTLPPPSSLVCSHCLLLDAFECEEIDSHSGHSRDDGSCDSPCSESHGQHSDDDQHSRKDCPCCAEGLDNNVLLTSVSRHIVDTASVNTKWLGIEYPQRSLCDVQCPEVMTSIWSPSLPNVLRI